MSLPCGMLPYGLTSNVPEHGLSPFMRALAHVPSPASPFHPPASFMRSNDSRARLQFLQAAEIDTRFRIVHGSVGRVTL